MARISVLVLAVPLLLVLLIPGKKAHFPGGSFNGWLAQGPAGFGVTADEFLQRNDPEAVIRRLVKALRQQDDSYQKAYAWVAAHAPAAISKKMRPLPNPRLVRIGATYWLAHIGPAAKRAIPQLRYAGSRDIFPDVRRSALWALGRIDTGSKESISILITSLSKDSDASVRAAAAGVLEVWAPEDERVIPAMIQALNDRDVIVRQIGAATLGKYGSKSSKAVESLSQLAAKDDPSADYAASAIRQIRGKTAPQK